jgi:chloramphenicol O-acetyltransferase type A
VTSQIDLSRWPRRAAFEFFRHYERPWFSVCTRVDAAALKAAQAGLGIGSFWLAYHYIAMALANQHEALRLRFSADGEGVHLLRRVHAGTTVLRADESFGMLTLHQTAGYAAYCTAAAPAVARAREPDAPFLPPNRLPADEGLIHTTTLPWLHFSSFDHARQRGIEPDVPKMAFGRAEREGQRLWLPLAVEAHHALVDGLHVGRYVQALEAAFAAPRDWLAD